MNEKTDRRSLKTRHAIYIALIELMNEKSFQNITIQEIIDKADIGRSTFYTHFETKFDLLESCVESIFDLLYEQSKGTDHQTSSHPLPLAVIYQHVFEHKHLIKGLLCGECEPYIIRKTQSYWADILENYLEGNGNPMPDGVPKELLTYHITSTMISLLRWWMDNGCMVSADKMEDYFYQLIPIR